MNCGECKIEKDKIIGEGSYGKVYLTCCNDGCNYATKIIDISEEDEEEYDSANKELNLSYLMADENIGPKICNKYSDIFKTEEGGDALYITMEKFQTTMTDYVDEYKVIDNEMQMKIYDVISKLHKLGFVHLDLHLGNLMIDKDGNVKIIDFGSTKKSTSKLLRYFDYFSFSYENLKIFDEKGILFKLYRASCREFNVKFSSEPQKFYIQFRDLKDNKFVNIVKKNLKLYKDKEEIAIRFKCDFIILLGDSYKYWYIRKDEDDIEEMLEGFLSRDD